jgi:hypothetical protein
MPLIAAGVGTGLGRKREEPAGVGVDIAAEAGALDVEPDVVLKDLFGVGRSTGSSSEKSSSQEFAAPSGFGESEWASTAETVSKMSSRSSVSESVAIVETDSGR